MPRSTPDKRLPLRWRKRIRPFQSRQREALPFYQLLLVTGQGDGVGGSSGTLTAQAAITATSAGAGGSTGTLNVTHAITGISAGVGGSTGTLAETAKITGIGAGIAGSSGSVIETGGTVTPITSAARSAAMGENIGQDGGFLVPEAWGTFVRSAFDANYTALENLITLRALGLINDDEFAALVATLPGEMTAQN